MWEDPIVKEIHEIRERLAARFNFDIDAIFEDMRKRQESLGDRLVSPKERVEPMPEADEQSSDAPVDTSTDVAPAA